MAFLTTPLPRRGSAHKRESLRFMGRARTLRRRKRGNGCRAVARHLKVAQPRCPSPGPSMKHVSGPLCKVAEEGPSEQLGPWLVSVRSLALPLLLIFGAAAVSTPSFVSRSSPFISESTFCPMHNGSDNQSRTVLVPFASEVMSFDQTLGFPGEGPPRNGKAKVVYAEAGSSSQHPSSRLSVEHAGYPACSSYGCEASTCTPAANPKHSAPGPSQWVSVRREQGHVPRPIAASAPWVSSPMRREGGDRPSSGLTSSP